MIKKERRIPLRARLRKVFCLTTGSHCRMEVQGRREVIVQGCCGIEAYSPCSIVLRVRDPDYCYLHICGSSLLCHSYHTDAVRLCGEIHGMELLRELPCAVIPGEEK